MPQLSYFLSAVSKEFASAREPEASTVEDINYRTALSSALKGTGAWVSIQEDFTAGGHGTLRKLDDYVRGCDGIIHLVGDMTGAPAHAALVDELIAHRPELRDPPFSDVLAGDLLYEFSYTQWEAYLALLNSKPLWIAVPHPSTVRGKGYVLDPEQRASQDAHLLRLRQFGRYPEISFKDPGSLAIAVMRAVMRGLLAANDSRAPEPALYRERRPLFSSPGSSTEMGAMRPGPPLEVDGFIESSRGDRTIGPVGEALFPRLRWIGGRPRFISGWQDRLHQQMQRDFRLSPLPTRAKVASALTDVLTKARTVGPIRERFRSDVDLVRATYVTCATDEALRTGPLKTLLECDRLISVSCQPTTPAILAALYDMRDRLNAPIEIDTSRRTGIEQIAKMIDGMAAGAPIDLAFLPTPAFLMTRHRGAPFDLTPSYAFVLPVHMQVQKILRRSHRDHHQGLSGINKIRFLIDGAPTEHVMDIVKKTDLPFVDKPFTITEHTTISRGVEMNEAIAVWDPLATQMVRSGGFVPITDFEYLTLPRTCSRS